MNAALDAARTLGRPVDIASGVMRNSFRHCLTVCRWVRGFSLSFVSRRRSFPALNFKIRNRVMALWGGRFTQAADQRFNNSTTHCVLITVWRSRILLACGLVQSPGNGRCADRRRTGALEEALNVLLEDVRARPQQILKATPKISIAGWKAN